MIVPSAPPVEHPVTYRAALCITPHGCKTPLDRPAAHPSRRRLSRVARRASTRFRSPPQDEVASARRSLVMSNLVHNEQVKLAATFWNNLSVAALLGVFLVPAFYTRHTMLKQARCIGVGLAAAIGLRMLAHWRLTRLREGNDRKTGAVRGSGALIMRLTPVRVV